MLHRGSQRFRRRLLLTEECLCAATSAEAIAFNFGATASERFSFRISFISGMAKSSGSGTAFIAVAAWVSARFAASFA